MPERSSDPATDAGADQLKPGQVDADRVRRAAARKPPEPRRRSGRGAPPSPPPAESPEADPHAAAKELFEFWNGVARARRYRRMNERQAVVIAGAMRRVEAKRGVQFGGVVDRFPEVLLAGMVLPFLVNALGAETRRLLKWWATTRAPRRPVPPRRDADRPSGVAEIEDLHRRTAAARGTPNEPQWDGRPVDASEG